MGYGSRFLNRLSKQYGKINTIRDVLSEVRGGYLSYLVGAPIHTQKEFLRRLERQVKARYEATILKYEIRSYVEKLEGRRKLRLEDIVRERRGQEELIELKSAVPVLRELLAETKYVDDKVRTIAKHLEEQGIKAQQQSKLPFYYIAAFPNVLRQYLRRVYNRLSNYLKNP